jgi:hypothetical protein
MPEKDPTSWRSHRCHDCGKRSSRSRCRTCRKALEERKVLANDPKAVARTKRRSAAHSDGDGA